jgi:hypothetical protein
MHITFYIACKYNWEKKYSFNRENVICYQILICHEILNLIFHYFLTNDIILSDHQKKYPYMYIQEIQNKIHSLTYTYYSHLSFIWHPKRIITIAWPPLTEIMNL